MVVTNRQMSPEGAVSLEKATLYEKYRLPYASDAANDLLGFLDVSKVVADIGAGTGQLSRLFADKCQKVYLVEPDPSMRKVAASALAQFNTIELCASTAENTGLPSNSIDLIVIGNAFHRFKPEACDELHRILKVNGWIALFAYGFKNSAFKEMRAAKLEKLKDLSGRIKKTSYLTPVNQLFGEGEVQKLIYPQSLRETWSGFFGAARAGIEAPGPDDCEYLEFRALNREIFDAFAVNGKIQIDYETRVLFGQPLFS